MRFGKGNTCSILGTNPPYWANDRTTVPHERLRYQMTNGLQDRIYKTDHRTTGQKLQYHMTNGLQDRVYKMDYRTETTVPND